MRTKLKKFNMEKKKTIWDYFEDNYEYPKEIAHNPIPYGVVWTYVSSTFLNGFINYVKPIKCYLADRYTSDDENISDRNIDYQNNGERDWFKFNGTKKELKEKIVSGKFEMYHTKLDCFGDDILILSEIETEENETINRYMFFWYDMDCSDCSIGKFETTDTKEQVIESMVNFLEKCKYENKDSVIKDGLDNGIINYTELPLSFLRGWVSFM
jgi:hypothetical protein